MTWMLAQLNATVGDVAGNTAKMLEVVEKARAHGVSMVLFPEMMVSGYPPRDLLKDPAFVTACVAQNERLAQASGEDLCVVWGNLALNPTGLGKPLWNVGYVAYGGKIQAQAVKNHLPTYDVFDDARYFEPGSVDAAIGTFEWQGRRYALSVCEDLWAHPAFEALDTHAISPYAYGTEIYGALPTAPDLWVNLSASPFVSSKPKARQDALIHLAQATSAGVLYVNTVGAQDDIVYDGHSLYVSPLGQVCMGPGFQESQVLVNPDSVSTGPGVLETALEGQWFDALVLGIADYFRKTGFSTAYIGLSGGIDSALVAVLATEALGKEHVVGVAMPGPYSSDHSVTDARALAANLGIQLLEHSIMAPYQAFLDLLSQGVPQQDLAEQNLQARLRGTLLMTLANRANALVLATSNKSELAMGYSTLYGDSCGALAPIGDLLKTQVYALCRWINREGEIIPQSTLNKAPSAELAPNQKDSDSLPPYEALDPCLQGVMEETWCVGNFEHFMYDRTQMCEDVLKRLWRAEFKRQQSPPVLKVSPRGFDSGWLTQIVKQVRL